MGHFKETILVDALVDTLGRTHGKGALMKQGGAVLVRGGTGTYGHRMVRSLVAKGAGRACPQPKSVTDTREPS